MRKLMAFLLSAALCLSLVTVSAAAATQPDKTAVSAAALSMMGALQGNGSGDLNLGGTLTRAQFCKIAVVTAGLSKSIGQYSSYTIFPDVPSSNWASGYVNLAVRSAGIMNGYPDGRFGPDDVITFAQAVTVLMRMLGYQTADVGAAWPEGYLSKAGDIGLTAGVSLTAESPVTRGQAAVLFVNLLNTPLNGSTKKFMTSISGATVIDGVFLVSVSAKTDDGTAGAVKIAGAGSGAYLPANGVSDTLRGLYGALVLNASGKALVMVPAKSGRTVVSTVSAVSSAGVKCADGTTITVPATASFFLNGTSGTYSTSWVNVKGGMLVSAYYSDGGAVQSILVADAASVTGDVTVVGVGSYTLPDSAAVYINGVKAAPTDIDKYDVLSDDGSGVYTVTRSRVTGTYDDATPNTDAPSAVTVLGTAFTVLDSAKSGLSSFKIGDSITLLLTSDNKVAGAVSGELLQEATIGIVTSLSAGSATVKLSSGIVISGSLKNTDSSIVKGSIVNVGSCDASHITLYPLAGNTNASMVLDVVAGTLGSRSLSKAITIYDRVGGSAVIESELSAIPTTSVEASKVKYYATDVAGRVSILLLDDVTGDVYTYGMLKTGSVTEKSGTMSATNPTVSVTNSTGTTTAVIGSTGLPDGTFIGIAANAGGTLAGYATLTAITGVSRSSFRTNSDGDVTVKTADGVIPVSDGVQAYIRSTATWATLDKARSYSDNLTVYYDKTTSDGKVRIVVAE